MNRLLICTICTVFLVSSKVIFSQSVGINTVTPLANLDIRSTDDINTGGELRLSTSTESNFLRLFSGRLADPHPFLAFHDQDSFHIVSTSPDWNTYKRIMTITPTGFVGIGNDRPKVELDISTAVPNDGSELHLSNSDKSHFLRLFSGNTALTYPIMYWNHGSHLEFSMANEDESNYQTFLTLDGKTVGVFNTGKSIFIGRDAGSLDDGSDNTNIAIGDQSMPNNITGERNLAIGDSTLFSQNGADNNLALGHTALRSLETGSRNVALGQYAAFQLTSGSGNTFVGSDAGSDATTSSENTAIGSEAGRFIDGGSQNVMMGKQAGFGVLDGDRNVYVGSHAASNLSGEIGGDDNVIIGAQAGFEGPGQRNTYLGAQAGSGNNGGIHNVLLGYEAGSSIDTINNNVLIGYQAGKGTSRDHTLMIDNSSTLSPLIYGEFDNNLLRINGRQEVTDEFNIAKSGVAMRVNGQEFLWSNGSYFSYGFGLGHNYFGRPVRVGPVEGNVAPFADLHVVDDDLANLTIESQTGDAKIQLAGNTDSPTSGWTIERDGSSGDLQFRHNNLLKMTMEDNGELGLGVLNPDKLLDIAGTMELSTPLNGANNYVAYISNTSDNNNFHNEGLQITAGHSAFDPARQSNFIRFANPSGAQTGRIGQIGNNSITYQASSDIRLKKDIVRSKFGLKEVLKLQPKDYYWKSDLNNDFMQTGFLAQEVYSVFPQAASKGGKDPVQDPWSVAPIELIPLLVNGMQEQQSMIEKQQGLIEELQQAVEILMANQK